MITTQYAGNPCCRTRLPPMDHFEKEEQRERKKERGKKRKKGNRVTEVDEEEERQAIFLSRTRLIYPWIIACPLGKTGWLGCSFFIGTFNFPFSFLFFFYFCLFLFPPLFFFFVLPRRKIAHWFSLQLKKQRHCGESHCHRHLIIESRTKTFCATLFEAARWGYIPHRWGVTERRVHANAVAVTFRGFIFELDRDWKWLKLACNAYSRGKWEWMAKEKELIA